MRQKEKNSAILKKQNKPKQSEKQTNKQTNHYNKTKQKQKIYGWIFMHSGIIESI